MIELRWVITGETRVLQWRHGYMWEGPRPQINWSDWQDVPEVQVFQCMEEQE